MALYIILGLVGILILVFGGFFIALYNGLVKLKNNIESAWSDIDVLLKKRYNLIPNLVETVKGYAKHESGIFEKVAKARSQAMQATDPGDKAQREGELTGMLKSLFAVTENYPNLQANQNFLDLQNQLSQVESEIEKSRRFYNGTVKQYNNQIQVFPNNIFAPMFGFKERKFFEVAEAERENVKVEF
jgi:LemA protein